MGENIIRINLSGRIDSGNVSDIEKTILSELESKSGDIIEFNAVELSYISSAGLRILMKIRKLENKPLRIIEVSPQVYDIFETTGFTELFEIKKALREISVEGCEMIGRGFYGTVYRLDEDTIVKLYDSPDSIPMIENERKMAKTAFLNGIPTAISYDIVRCGGKYGTVFELLKAKSYNDVLIQDPSGASALVKNYVDFLKLVHDTELNDRSIPYTRDIYSGYVDVIKDYITPHSFSRLKELFDSMPKDNHAVHGDFQMKNVMIVDGESMLIDMDTLSRGNPVFDLAGLYVTYREFEEDEPGNTMSFLGISAETSLLVWNRILEYYFGATDPGTLSQVTDKIKLAAAVRFLFLLAVSDLKNGALGEIRIAHTRSRINELVDTVSELAL